MEAPLVTQAVQQWLTCWTCSQAHLQGVHGLHDGGATGDQVLHDEARLPRRDAPLNRLFGAVVLDLHALRGQQGFRAQGACRQLSAACKEVCTVHSSACCDRGCSLVRCRCPADCSKVASSGARPAWGAGSMAAVNKAGSAMAKLQDYAATPPCAA